jgi:hypothetical protein
MYETGTGQQVAHLHDSYMMVVVVVVVVVVVMVMMLMITYNTLLVCL